MGTQKASGGGGGSSGAVRAGGAFFELFAKDNLTKVLDKIQQRVKNFGSALSKAGGVGMGAGAALGAGPLGLLLGGGSRLADTARLARQFQIPIELMGKFQHAAEMAGVGVEEVMGDTSGRFADLLAKAPLIDPDEAKAALQIQNDFTNSIRSLQEALTPVLTTLAPIVRDVTSFIQANAGATKVLAGVSLGLLGMGAILKVTGISIAGLAAAVPAAFTAMLSPIGLVTLAVAGVTAAFLTQTETGREMFSNLKSGFNEFVDTATEAWGGIVAAIGRGDIEAATEVALAGVSLEWRKAVAWWTEIFNKFKGTVVDGWGEMTTDIAQGFAAIGEEMGMLPQGTVHEIRREHNRLQKENHAQRDKDLAEARAAVEAAKARLSRGVAAAKNPGGDFGGGGDFADPIAHELEKQRLRIFRYTDTKGSFNTSAARQQFGYSDKVAQQTELLKSLVDGKGQLPDKIGDKLAQVLKIGG